MKLLLIGALVGVTNPGSLARIPVLINDHRVTTAVIYSALWAMSIAVILLAAFHPSRTVRCFWGVVLGISGSAAFLYSTVNGAEFFTIDLLNFWSARHEAGRALDFHQSAVISAILVFSAWLVAFMLPPPQRETKLLKWRRLQGASPVLPVALIACVILYREGKGSDALPRQFAPLSMAALGSYKLATFSFPTRDAVGITRGQPLSRAIVLLVDESVRADAIDLSPLTVQASATHDREAQWVDLGPGASGGNCSNISNALLRFMASRTDVVGSVLRSPTVWQYARHAGYRTVYIDAQAGFIKIYGKLQNFMTPGEAAAIDTFHKLTDDIKTHDLDEALVRIIKQELAKGDRIFIFANKNGAHFPYEANAPDMGATQNDGSEAGDPARMPPSYLRAIRWNTDRLLADLDSNMAWDDATVIYTSDHGQHFESGRLTHCSNLAAVNQNEGVVPLLIASDNAQLLARFRQFAANYKGRGSHFAIAPTVLELMGYSSPDIRARYPESLLYGVPPAPQFLSGDIFAIFSNGPIWHDVDPMVQRREPVDMNHAADTLTATNGP
ncbi:sulfatase-like hydrolase/transferase [Camelimonas sp. ID_303_24]